MRDIKFRAWKKYTQKYLESDELLMNLSNSNLQNLAGGTFRPSDVTVEQYTGLKDKNGVEIYENDIIEIADTSYSDNGKHYGVVEYSEYAELVVGNILLSRVYKAIKVIGNIHENIDLLAEDIERVIPDDIGNDIHDFLHGGEK